MKLLLPLDSRLRETQGFCILDTEDGSHTLTRSIEELPYARKGFRGACKVAPDVLAVCTSRSLKFYKILQGDQGEIRFDCVRQVFRPEWLLGRGANADLHIPYLDAVSGELWLANSYMDCIDRFTPEGDFIGRRFLWEISAEIDHLVQERNPRAADLCHLNYFGQIGSERVATLGNLNGSGLGAILSLESGEILLNGLGRPHDGVWHGGDFFITETSRYRLLVYENINAANEIKESKPRIIDLSPSGSVSEENQFWLRGLHVDENTVLVGCSQFQDRKTRAVGVFPTQIIKVDRGSGQVLERIDVPQSEELENPVVYSLLDLETML